MHRVDIEEIRRLVGRKHDFSIGGWIRIEGNANPVTVSILREPPVWVGSKHVIRTFDCVCPLAICQIRRTHLVDTGDRRRREGIVRFKQLRFAVDLHFHIRAKLYRQQSCVGNCCNCCCGHAKRKTQHMESGFLRSHFQCSFLAFMLEFIHTSLCLC